MVMNHSSVLHIVYTVVEYLLRAHVIVDCNDGPDDETGRHSGALLRHQVDRRRQGLRMEVAIFDDVNERTRHCVPL